MKNTLLLGALALAFPLAAQAQSNADLKKEIDQLRAQQDVRSREFDLLKAQLAELRVAMSAKPVAPAAVARVDPAEFNRLRVVVETLEDAQEKSGLKDFKVSGFMDPVFLYNQRTGRSAVQFMNATDGMTNDLHTDAWGYATSNLGGATIKFEKNFGDGNMVVAMRPRKDTTFGGVFETALLTIPLDGRVSFMAGKSPAWNGYELADAPSNKLVTHNLLFDFGGPSFVTGAGFKFDAFGLNFQTIIGNLNSTHDLPGSRNSGVHWRADHWNGEFSGWGISGMHGNVYGSRYNYLDVDFWYVRGDLTLSAQIEASRHAKAAFNLGDASHLGLSGLAAYKLTPVWEAVVRADWFDNSKNGGGGPAMLFNSGQCDDSNGTLVDCGDIRSGFGPGMEYVGGAWGITNPDRGAKRIALSLGLNYAWGDHSQLKFELRHDRSDMNSFLDLKDGAYKKSNNVVGVQSVVKF